MFLEIYLFEGERGQGQRERESHEDSAPSAEPDVGFDPTTLSLRSLPRLKPKVRRCGTQVPLPISIYWLQVQLSKKKKL